jgi:hypothetical protein
VKVRIGTVERKFLKIIDQTGESPPFDSAKADETKFCAFATHTVEEERIECRSGGGEGRSYFAQKRWRVFLYNGAEEVR